MEQKKKLEVGEKYLTLNFGGKDSKLSIPLFKKVSEKGLEYYAGAIPVTIFINKKKATQAKIEDNNDI